MLNLEDSAFIMILKKKYRFMDKEDWSTDL